MLFLCGLLQLSRLSSDFKSFQVHRRPRQRQEGDDGPRAEATSLVGAPEAAAGCQEEHPQGQAACHAGGRHDEVAGEVAQVGLRELQVVDH